MPGQAAKKPSTRVGKKQETRAVKVPLRASQEEKNGPSLQITPRDREVLAWITRHGVVSILQIANRFFVTEAGDVSYEGARRRIYKLRNAQPALVQLDKTFWNEPSAVRVTRQGAFLADVDLVPVGFHRFDGHPPSGARPRKGWADSTSQRKNLGELLHWCHESKRFAWTTVQTIGNERQPFGTVEREIRSLRHVLTEQAIGVLVGAALPGAVGVAEVDLDAGVDREALVARHLPALIPGDTPL